MTVQGTLTGSLLVVAQTGERPAQAQLRYGRLEPCPGSPAMPVRGGGSSCRRVLQVRCIRCGARTGGTRKIALGLRITLQHHLGY